MQLVMMGLWPDQRIIQKQLVKVSEISANYATAQEALAWLNSPTHKVTIEGILLILELQ
jgi:hypothetical protein